MRPLVTSAVLHLVGTLAAGLALSAADTTLAVAAVASLFAVLLWFASLHSTADASGLPLASGTALVGLTLTGRSPVARLLPLLAAQVVGSVLAGLALVGLDRLDGSALLVWDTPELLVVGLVSAVVGLLAAWVVLAVDGGASPAWWVAPGVAAGAVLNVALVGAVSPGVLTGLAVAGILTWPTALVTAAGALVGAGAGVYAVAAVTPAAE